MLNKEHIDLCSFNELLKQNNKIKSLRLLTDSVSQEIDSKISTSSSSYSSTACVNTNTSSQIAKLIFDRCTTILSVAKITDQDPTEAIASWNEYVYQWIWVNSHSSLRTHEILRSCHELAPNANLFPVTIGNTDSGAETKTSSKPAQTTFLVCVLHQELSEIKSKQENNATLTDDESDRIGFLFETMIQLDIDTFMMIASEYPTLLSSTLNNRYQALHDPSFRQSLNGLKTFQYFVEEARDKHDKIKLDEFIQVSSWALDYIRNNPEDEAIIKQSILPYVAKFFNDYSNKKTVLNPNDDPIHHLINFTPLRIHVAHQSFINESLGMSTQAKKIDLAYPKSSPLVSTLGLFSENPANRKGAFASLQRSRVKIEALDLAGFERIKVKDNDDRHPLANDAIKQFENYLIL